MKPSDFNGRFVIFSYQMETERSYSDVDLCLNGMFWRNSNPQ